MVSILPAEDSFGSSLGSLLGGGIGFGIGNKMQQFQQQKQRKQQSSALSKLLDMPEEHHESFMSLDPEYQKLLAQSYLKQKEIEKKNQAKSGVGAPGKMGPEEKAAIQSTFDRMSSMIGGPMQRRTGKFFPTLDTASAEERGEFDTLGVQLESIFKDMVNKGTMSNSRFQFMLKNLPTSSDAPATQKGKLKAIAKMLELDLGNIGVGEQKPFMGGKVKIRDPESGKIFYPSSAEEVNQAKKLNLEILNE